MTRKNVFWTLPSALRRNLIILFCASLCFWGGLAGILPNLSPYIRTFGASDQQIGWVMASFAVGLLFFRPRMSKMTDRRGRKPALLIGVAVIALAPVMYLGVGLIPASVITFPRLGWTISSSVLWLMGVRAFHGISVAAFATAYTAAVADMAPPEHRGQLIGTMSLAGPLGMSMGPALGGHLSSNLLWAFLSMAAIGTVGTFCVLISQEPPSAKPLPADIAETDSSRIAPGRTLEKTAFWSRLLTPSIRIPALMLFMVGIAFGTIVAFVPLYVQERGWVFNIGLMYTVSALTSFSVRAVAGPASDTLGRGRFISLGLLSYSLAMFTLCLSTSPQMLLLAGFFQGAGSGSLIPIVAALMTDRSRPGERGVTFGLCLTGFDLGIALAGPALGYVADELGSYTLIFALAGCMTVLGLCLFITLSSKDIPHSMRFALNNGRDVYAIPSSTQTR